MITSNTTTTTTNNNNDNSNNNDNNDNSDNSAGAGSLGRGSHAGTVSSRAGRIHGIISEKGGGAPKRGRHSTTCFSTKMHLCSGSLMV